MSRFSAINERASQIVQKHNGDDTLIEPMLASDFGAARNDPARSPFRATGIVSAHNDVQSVSIGGDRPLQARPATGAIQVRYRESVFGSQDAWPRKGWRIVNLAKRENYVVAFCQSDGQGNLFVHCVRE